MKKILISLLIAAMLIPAISSCAMKPVLSTPDTALLEEMKSPLTKTSVPVDNEKTEDGLVLNRVSIFTGNTESEIYAGEELAKYLNQKYVTVTDGAFPITISIDSSLEDDAFIIEAITEGQNAGMTIKGGNERGVLYGVYKFLEEKGGVRYFMPDLETVPDSAIIIQDGVVLEYTPYFESRRINWNCVGGNADWCVKNGVNASFTDMSGKFGGSWNYGPLFVHTLGTLTEYDANGDGVIDYNDDNPCLSSEENLQKVIANVRKVLEADPTINIVSVSQNDRNVYCTCADCAASDAYYSTNPNDPTKGGPAGTMLAFVNKVAEALETDYPDLVIDTLAYNYTQAPPQNIVPRENVCVRVCSIRVCFMHPMTECPENKGPNNIQWTRTKLFMNDFVNWGKICDRIFVWDYTTNFAYYIAPFSNFGAIRENMKFYHENGVRGMFPQGNSQSPSGEFGELRAYLLAKLMWNPYMSEEEYYAHMDEFLQAYYGAAWIYMRLYIEKTTELAYDGCINIYEEPLQSITAAEYLMMESTFDNWWDHAELVAGDRAEYVHRSSMQWRYIKLMLHPNDEEALAFAEEIEALGIRWAESEGNNYPLHVKFPDLYPNLQSKEEE